MTSTLQSLLVGAISTLALVAALFFLKFWRRTRDPFFLLFSIAFCLYSLSQLALEMVGVPEFEPLYYIPRLMTFVLIVVAVVGKNRG